MFSDAWVFLGIILIGMGTWFRQPGMLALGILLLVILPIAWAWKRLTLRAVSYERVLDESRVFAGETTGLRLITTNRKPLPVPWLTIEDTFPAGLEVVERDTGPAASGGERTLSNVMALRWYERVVRQYTLHCSQRGFYFIGPATLRSGDLFGLFETRARVSAATRLIVYPQVTPLEELGFPAKEPFGDARSLQPIFEDPLRTVGIRDYQPEDSFRHVHWKASARQQHLQTRVYEPTTTQRIVIVLNIATFANPWVGILPDAQEQVISVAASIAYHATQRRQAVGLVANGSVPRSDQTIRVMPSRDPGVLTRILEALAAVGQFSTERIERILAQENPRLPWGATLVVVTCVVTPELIAEMARLRSAARRMVLVSLDAAYTEESLPGIVIYHIPTAEMQYRRREAAVTPAGAPTLPDDPDAIFRRPAGGAP
ncbi:MAG: DUF58 domain-containing protein [Anaerolineae bacterium]|nr:DUF58 domain-containing protein [Anaerolineae bacterium]